MLRVTRPLLFLARLAQRRETRGPALTAMLDARLEAGERDEPTRRLDGEAEHVRHVHRPQR